MPEDKLNFEFKKVDDKTHHVFFNGEVRGFIKKLYSPRVDKDCWYFSSDNSIYVFSSTDLVKISKYIDFLNA